MENIQTKKVVRLDVSFNGNPAVKDTIESKGIVHTEICALTINGNWVSLDEKLKQGARVEVYPFHYLNTDPPNSRRLLPDSNTAFVIDGNLGKLVRRLRLLGFDTVYHNNAPDSILALAAAREGRVLLTRDKNLLKHRIIEYGYWVRSELVTEQTLEIVRRYNLIDKIKPFSICIRCNGKIKPVTKREIYDKLLPVAREHYEEFEICQLCSQIYWKGPHYEKMHAFVDLVKKSVL